MTEPLKPVPTDITEDDRKLLAGVRNRFAEIVGPDNGPGVLLFTTDTADLWTMFLNTLPPELRQVYNCNACRRFVERFGGLVTIMPEGFQRSAMWNDGTGPFTVAVRVMAEYVEHARVTGVFVSSEAQWGTPVTGEWNHFAVTPPPKMVWKDRLKNAGQRAAELREEFGILRRSLAEYPIEVIQNAYNLLTTGQLYRSEKCIGVAEWALKLHGTIAARPGRLMKEATTWLAAATAPPGFCHIKTTAISSLLDNIVAGKPFADIKREFDAMMAPSRYQRAQTPPAAANVEQAEAVVARLGLERSLLRRYAQLGEVVPLWTPTPQKGAPKAEEPAAAPGVFAHLKTKEPDAPPAVVANASTMTWDKFQRTVLPSAIKLEAQIPTTADRFAALVTAVDLEAPPILQWDREDARNPVSWYYAAGIDAEIKRRVLDAGGQYENVDIRASLIWNNRNDLDLHVITPAMEHIYFAAQRSRCGGWLDVDMNVRGETTKPVENIRWMRGTARDGVYRVYVQNYAFHESSTVPTPFRVELEIAGEVFHFEGVMPARVTGGASDMPIVAFTLAGRRLGQMTAALRPTRATGVAGAWNVTPGQWVPVTAIAQSPNLWGATPMIQHGEHLFFLLAGCRDTKQGIGRGFFVETLRSELRSVRATLEAYTASTPIAGAEEASACGLGMAKGSPWDLTLRVTSHTGVNTYKLDRWD